MDQESLAFIMLITMTRSSESFQPTKKIKVAKHSLPTNKDRKTRHTTLSKSGKAKASAICTLMQASTGHS